MHRSSRAQVVLLALALAGGLAAVLSGPPAAVAQERESAPEKRPTSPDEDQVPANQGSAPEHEEDDLLFPMKRNLWFQQQRAYPNAHIPQGAYWHAQVQRKANLERHRAEIQKNALRPAAQADLASSVTWTPDGPQPAAAYYGPTPYSGRATALAVHPSDPNTVYLGTSAGGVWKTTDGGTTWNPLTDSQASLAIGAVAIDPNNPNTVFVGTGEPDFSIDSYYGQGLLKSTDAGQTWTLIRTPFTSGDTAPEFTSIAVMPGNSNIVLAANLEGVYRSADGGTTWKLELNVGTTAMRLDVKTPSTVYAGAGGWNVTAGPLFKSTDSGQTWTAMNGTGANTVPAYSAVFRTAITEDAAGKTLYAAFARSDFGAPGSLYKSVDGGANWTKLSSPSSSDGLDWYRDAIAVAPTNSQVLYASGAGLYESTDGGNTWSENSSGVYADQHAFAFSGDGSRMYLADDGGVFVTLTPAAANAPFTSLNTTLNTMTFYPGFSILAGQPNSLLAGSQDHGLNLYTGSLAWANGEQSGYCGDGGSVYVDPQAHYSYAHCEGGAADWTANPTGDASTTSWVAAQSGISAGDRWPWVADIQGDQQTISTVYTGTNHLYQSTNSAASWTSISPDLTAGSSTVTTIAIAPTDSNTIYAGAGDGTVSVTSNALAGIGATWKTVSGPLSGLPVRSISKIVVQPDSAQDVYVTVSGFDTGHVFHSTNGGATWSNISGDLPNTPVNSIAIDAVLPGTIYLATDTGVYVTQNSGVNWTPLGQGLPNVVIQDILLYGPTRTLRVITHGRGAWDAVVTAGTAIPQSIFLANPGPRTYGVSPITLNATATSGLPISYSVTSGPGTMTGTALKITGAGPVTVQAAQAGNTLYSAATPVSVVITVNPAPLTVTVNNATKVYGTVNPAFSGTIAGAVNGDTLMAAYSSTATAASPVGSYAITAMLSGAAAANYTATIMPGTLTVSKAALTVVANNQAVALGATIPALGGILTGVVAGDGITASYTTTAVQGSAVGSYPIAAALNDPGNKLSNYSVTIANGTLVIYNTALVLPLWMSSNNATVGGAGFVLTVSGANFPSNARVLWNGAVRTTTFVSSTHLTAAIFAADILNEGTMLVTVSNAAPNAATSAALPFAVMSATPVAKISGGSISLAADGSGNHKVTLTGSDFVSSSIVKWNGATLTTNYVSPWQISAVLPASDFTSPPGVFTVVNPAGGSVGITLP